MPEKIHVLQDLAGKALVGATTSSELQHEAKGGSSSSNSGLSGDIGKQAVGSNIAVKHPVALSQQEEGEPWGAG